MTEIQRVNPGPMDDGMGDSADELDGYFSDDPPISNKLPESNVKLMTDIRHSRTNSEVPDNNTKRTDTLTVTATKPKTSNPKLKDENEAIRRVLNS